MSWASGYLENGFKIVDYSGDFRFLSQAEYASYAERIGRSPDHTAPEVMKNLFMA